MPNVLHLFRLPVPAVLVGTFLLAACTDPDAGRAVAPAVESSSALATQAAQPVLNSRSIAQLQHDGLRFRDLDRDGALTPYEDWRLPAAERARDLVARMTLEEKAGAMLHGSLAGTEAYDPALVRQSVLERKVTHLITRLAGAPLVMAQQNNAIQAIAEEGRLGIPLTISTDPRHHFQYTEGASVAAGGFTQWPEPLGFAALGEAERVRRFADSARREYRATGIHMGLSPQADLATEPRWSRINGTFGEDAALAGTLVQAYVEGFQGGSDGVGPDGVALVVKHWVGYGAADQGFDSHNYYGRHAVFPGNNFAYHVTPFLGAFASRVAGVMPTYSILKDLVIEGRPVEQTGAGFSKLLLNDLLRGKHGFDGIVLSDWAITRDCPQVCIEGRDGDTTQTFATLSTAWGVIDLPMPQRFALGIAAGIDQFGGTEEQQVLLEAVQQGLVDEARLDVSVQRLMQQKFELGLFDAPFVDEAAVATAVGSPADLALAEATQREAQVLLENRDELLPVAPAGQKLWLHGVARAAAEAAGYSVVDSVAEADLALIRSATPFEILHPDYVFGAMQHEGRLDYADDHPDFVALRAAAAAGVPVVFSVTMDRPAILTRVREHAAAILANFGASDAALLDVLSGRAAPRGKLPFALPADMASVERQFPDVPFDLEGALYPFGHGLHYRESVAAQ